ncbi:MAG TPA: hypothetical protein DEA08_14385 [Planctomycetes bacterium]|nr:hypothetical protein [Planctomycetota bacterium]
MADPGITRTLLQVAVERGYATPAQVASLPAGNKLAALAGLVSAPQLAELRRLYQQLEQQHQQLGATHADRTLAPPPPAASTSADPSATAAAPSTPRDLHPPPAGAGAWSSGSLVDGWRLLEKLGEGGMGVVYRVQHEQTGAVGALKALSRAAGGDRVPRFQREGQAMARADRHPNVLRVRSAGEHQGKLFMIMDFAEGGDLAARLKTQGPLEWREAFRIGVGLCRGIAHAHAAGVLHRDLKPANVVFQRDGTPLVADFGLARVEGEGSLTLSGAMLGSPRHMSPEQANSRAKHADERTDVYGLGAILFHMVTGRPPADGDTMVEVLNQVLRGAIPAPSEVVPGLPPEVDAVVLRALACEPDARYPSANDLASALEGLLDARSLPSQSRRPGWLAVSGALLAAAALGAGLLWANARPPAPGSAPASPTTPPAQATPSPSPPSAEGTLWRLAPGEAYLLEVTFDERGSGQQMRLDGSLDLLVERIEDGVAYLQLSRRRTAVRMGMMSFASAPSDLDAPADRKAPVNELIDQSVQDFRARLVLSTGAWTMLGLEETQARMKELLPAGMEPLLQVFSNEYLTATTTALTHVRSEDWAEGETPGRYVLDRTTEQPVPFTITPERIAHQEAEALYEDGRLRRARALQSAGKDHTLAWTWQLQGPLPRGQ